MSNLTNWLFANQQPPSKKKSPETKSGDIPLCMAIAVLVIVVIIIMWPEPPLIEVHESTACPVKEEFLAGTTYLLIDLSEKLSASQQQYLKDTRFNIADNLKDHEQINISRMQADKNSPTKRLDKFCKPDFSDLIKYGRSFPYKKDCKDVIKNSKKYPWHPTINGKAAREQIKNACVRFQEFKERAEKFEIPTDQGDEHSYIAEAINATIIYREREARKSKVSKPARLIMFSDMLQNTREFSQYPHKGKKPDPNTWGVEKLLDVIENVNPFDSVLACFLKPFQPNMQPQDIRLANEKLWNEFFDYGKISKGRYKYAAANECAEEAKFFMMNDG